jgi:hypothetical protein
MGVPLMKILDDIDLTEMEFLDICKRFTNKKLFKLDEEFNLLLDKQGNLIKINYDN